MTDSYRDWVEDTAVELGADGLQELALLVAGSPRFPLARVLGLFLRRCPAAIPRLVIAVVIDAVNRVFERWSSAHVAQECRKVGLPFWTHLNPARSVVLIALSLGVIAAGFHAGPNTVLGAEPRPANGLPMGAPQGTHALALEAPTRSREATPQMVRGDDALYAALTPAEPSVTPTVQPVRNLVENRPALERLTGNVYPWRHPVRIAADTLRPSVSRHLLSHFTAVLI